MVKYLIISVIICLGLLLSCHENNNVTGSNDKQADTSEYQDSISISEQSKSLNDTIVIVNDDIIISNYSYFNSDSIYKKINGSYEKRFELVKNIHVKNLIDTIEYFQNDSNRFQFYKASYDNKRILTAYYLKSEENTVGPFIFHLLGESSFKKKNKITNVTKVIRLIDTEQSSQLIGNYIDGNITFLSFKMNVD